MNAEMLYFGKAHNMHSFSVYSFDSYAKVTANTTLWKA